MVEQNTETEINITHEDITTVLSGKINLISNFEIQIAALKRTVLRLQEEALSCQCEEEQEPNSDSQ